MTSVQQNTKFVILYSINMPNLLKIDSGGRFSSVIIYRFGCREPYGSSREMIKVQPNDDGASRFVVEFQVLARFTGVLHQDQLAALLMCSQSRAVVEPQVPV